MVSVTGLISEIAKVGETFTTYNFEVDDFHTYYVLQEGKKDGAFAVWVHNVKGCGLGYISGDKGMLKSLVRKAKTGDQGAIGELNTIKRLRASGQNVHVINPGLRPGVTHDIFFGGRKGLAEGIRGEIKTLTGQGGGRIIRTRLNKAISQLEPHGGGTIFFENLSTSGHLDVLHYTSRKSRSSVIDIIVNTP